MTDSVTSTTLLNCVAETTDEAAARAFVARYGEIVRAIGRHAKLPSEDQEDLVQDVMTAAVVALREKRYDRDRGRFKVWLKGVIANKIADVRRRASRQICAQKSSANTGEPERGNVQQLTDVPDPHLSPAEEYEAAFETEWQKVAYEEALDEIRTEVEPTTFQAFDLVVRKGQKPGEVARLLGLTRNAIYVAKNRVETKLKEKLGSLG